MESAADHLSDAEQVRTIKAIEAFFLAKREGKSESMDAVFAVARSGPSL
jgi:hypothetical protein